MDINNIFLESQEILKKKKKRSKEKNKKNYNKNKNNINNDIKIYSYLQDDLYFLLFNIILI